MSSERGHIAMSEKLDSMLVTLPEASQLLGLSARKISQLVADGVLPSLKIDRCRRFSVKALEQWVESQIEGQV